MESEFTHRVIRVRNAKGHVGMERVIGVPRRVIESFDKAIRGPNNHFGVEVQRGQAFRICDIVLRSLHHQCQWQKNKEN